MNILENQIVLIIDDKPENISLAADFLESQGISVMMARSGLDGLQTAREGQPDLILLDVRMPDIDGYETCHRLKQDAHTREIPVIFMTAMTNLDDKLKGFSVGGVDYITKPLQEPELLARVGVHLRLSTLQRELAEKNLRLEGALDTGNVVNVAVGVLMERRGITREEAFEVIRQQARSQRRKVAEVAAEILAQVQTYGSAK
jgi:DNA-binding response OmpR family regulator